MPGGAWERGYIVQPQTFLTKLNDPTVHTSDRTCDHDRAHGSTLAWIPSKPCFSSSWTGYQISGLFPTGRSALGHSSHKGNMREPLPPARITGWNSIAIRVLRALCSCALIRTKFTAESAHSALINMSKCCDGVRIPELWNGWQLAVRALATRICRSRYQAWPETLLHYCKSDR